MVGQHMEHVVEGHTEDDATNAERQYRELALQPVHHGESKQRTEDNGQQEQRDEVPTTEAQQQEDQYQGQCT